MYNVVYQNKSYLNKVKSSLAGFFLVTDQQAGKLYKIEKQTLTHEQLPLTGLSSPQYVSFDPVTQRVFWVQNSGTRIESTVLGGTGGKMTFLQTSKCNTPYSRIAQRQLKSQP